MPPSAMTDYDLQRAENIRQNEALLKSLDLKGLGSSVGLKRSASTRSGTPGSTASASKKARTKNPPKPRERVQPSRTSARVQGLQATAEELEKKRQQDEERDEKERLERRRLKHKDREFGAEALLVKDDQEWLTNGLWGAFGGIEEGTKNGKDVKPQRDADRKKDEYASVRQTLESLSLESFSKVTPNRVYCAAFHPTVDKDLIFMGDKLGAVGIWDASSTPSVPPVKTDPADEDVDAKAADAKEPDEEEVAEGDGPNRGNAFVVQGHSRNAISSIKLDPLNPHQLYTASYDSTIRMLNFETHMNVEIIDGDALDDASGDALFSAMDFANEGRELWASDNQGGLTHRDLREPKQSARRWQVQEKKVGCVNLCPINGQKWAVTAGLNREMRIWDLYSLMHTPPDSSIAVNEKHACVSMYTHGLACSSAYFDPSGTRILSTSYDDFVRVWDVGEHTKKGVPWADDLKKADQRIKHDNQTGRWVTVFKAQWCPSPTDAPHFTIGNMRHKVDVYAATGDLLATFEDENLTTVPAVTTEHPVLGAQRVAGMTAGGKCYLWKKP